MSPEGGASRLARAPGVDAADDDVGAQARAREAPADRARDTRLASFGSDRDDRGARSREGDAERAGAQRGPLRDGVAGDERGAMGLREPVLEAQPDRAPFPARPRLDEGREPAGLGRGVGDRDAPGERRARAPGRELEMGMDDDEPQGRRGPQRHDLRAARRDDDEPAAHEAREDVVPMPRAVGDVLADERRDEQAFLVRGAGLPCASSSPSAAARPGSERERRGEGAGCGGSRRRAEPRGERQALAQDEIEPERRALLPQHRRRRDRRAVARGGARQTPRVPLDRQDADARPLRPPHGDGVAETPREGAAAMAAPSRPQGRDRGREGVEARPEVRDRRGGEGGPPSLLARGLHDRLAPRRAAAGGRRSAPRSRAAMQSLWTAVTAAPASRSSTMNEMLTSDEPWAIASTLIRAEATAEKSRAATPGVPRIPSPTAATAATGPCALTPSSLPSAISAPNSSRSAWNERARSSSG